MVTQQSLKLQASEAVVPGSNPGTPTKITKLLVCLILKNYMKK